MIMRPLIIIASIFGVVCAVVYIGATFNGDTDVSQVEILTESASPSDWGYSASNGPAVWASMTGLNRDCSKGVLQSPIDIRAADVSSKINGLPPLSWDYSSDSSSATESYDGRAFIVTFSGTPPKITTLDFSKYLDVVPLSAVANTTYSLKKIVLHTPSENLLDGARCAPSQTPDAAPTRLQHSTAQYCSPAHNLISCRRAPHTTAHHDMTAAPRTRRYIGELQYIHECGPTTSPSCPATKTLVPPLSPPRGCPLTRHPPPARPPSLPSPTTPPVRPAARACAG